MVELAKPKTFESMVLQADKPVLVKFTADWCVHCRRLSPLFERVSKKLGDKVDFVAVDVDQYPDIAEKYQVELIPTLMLFQNGKPSKPLINPPTEESLIDFLHQHHVV